MWTTGNEKNHKKGGDYESNCKDEKQQKNGRLAAIFRRTYRSMREEK